MLSDSLLNLGRIHWYLLNAHQQREIKKNALSPSGVIQNSIQVDLANEVQNDVTHWWVFEKERDLVALRKENEKVQGTFHGFKWSADQFSFNHFQTLDELILEYDRFAESYHREITVILNYVQWLYQRDELAPSMLFNYLVWGGTKMGFRVTQVGDDDFNNPNALEKLTLIVLGLVIRDQPVNEWAGKFAEQDPARLSSKDSGGTMDQELRLKRVVETRAVRMAASAFADYFADLWNGLRNIEINIEKREKQEQLFTSDDFWRSFITVAAKSAKTEQKYWDFKETLGMWRANGTARSQTAHDFAEKVAGFANNQGGVLLVGITDKSPRQIVGMESDSTAIENNMKYTRKVIGDYIDYNPDFVHFQQVNVQNASGEMKLCLVIAIKKTGSVMAVKGMDAKGNASGRSYSYPFREETGLVWKDQNYISNQKAGVKYDNLDFLKVLQQFINEETG